MAAVVQVLKALVMLFQMEAMEVLAVTLLLMASGAANRRCLR